MNKISKTRERPRQLSSPNNQGQVIPLGQNYNPPASPEAEQAVLGATLIRPELMDQVAALLSPDDFYREAHGRIFQAMMDLYGKKEPIDLVTITALLKERGQLEGVGGPGFLAGLAEQVGFAVNADYYAGIVRDKSVLRRMLKASQEIAGKCLSPVDSMEGFVSDAKNLIDDVASLAVQSEPRKAEELVEQETRAIESVFESKALPGMPVGFRDLDRFVSFDRADFIVLGARPSMGKTALALNIAAKQAIRGTPVLFFSLESTKEQLTRRLIASEGRINAQRLKWVRLNGEEWARLYDAGAKISALPLWIDDSPSLTIHSIRTRTRQMLRKVKVGLVVVDYLQMMAPVRRERSRDEEIKEISRGLKALAKELMIPVLALSQLNRRLEDRPDKRPKLSDLRESGNIEQDADTALFIYRDEFYRKNSPDEGKAEILVEKQRNGRTGTVKLAYLGEYLRFEDLVEDVPF